MRTWFRSARDKKNMSQDELSILAGVHVTTISKIELGERRPSPELAQKLGKLLGFDWTRFFEADDESGDKPA